VNQRVALTVVGSVVFAALLFVALRGCFKKGNVAFDMDAGDAAVDAGQLSCTRAPTGAELGRGDLVMGEVVATPDGFALGLLRSSKASVALLKMKGQDLGDVSFVELGKGVGDLPPPRPFVLERQVFFAHYTAVAEKSRTLEVARLGGPKGLEIRCERDESPAFDAAGSGDRALVAWDEDLGDGGAIKVVSLRAALEAAEPSTVSNGGDVESPRVFAREGGGFWVAWLARRRDARGEPDADTLERAGEDRTFSWVEVARVDETGHRVGDVHKVTAESGYARAFELSGRALLVRDDTEAHAGEGGRLLRVTLHDDGSPEPVAVVVPAGVGRADPDLFGNPPWVAYTDVAEAVHLVPLGAAALLSPSAGATPALDGKRVLGAVLPPAGALGHPAEELRFLAASAVENAAASAEAHIISCAR